MTKHAEQCRAAEHMARELTHQHFLSAGGYAFEPVVLASGPWAFMGAEYDYFPGWSEGFPAKYHAIVLARTVQVFEDAPRPPGYFRGVRVAWGTMQGHDRTCCWCDGSGCAECEEGIVDVDACVWAVYDTGHVACYWYEYRMQHDPGDAWGSAMGALFDVNNELECRGEETTESYRPGAFGPYPVEEYSMPELEDASDDQLHYLRVRLERYVSLLKGAGKDY